jgi:hypothetical protein
VKTPRPAGIGLALMIPVVICGLLVLLLSEAGPHEVVVRGVPADFLEDMESVPEAEASLSAEQAIGLARDVAHAPNASIRQAVLGRYPDNSGNESLRGRLVWVVTFADPREIAMRPPGPGYGGRDYSCDWALHPAWAFAEIDDESGEAVSLGGGGTVVDTSWPIEGMEMTDAERERCDRVLREQISPGS